MLNSQGYIGLPDEDLTYNYFAKDYQGNVKEVYSIAGANATTARCIQRMQYYPSGLPWEDNFGANAQPYKYGSKEFVEMHSLDEYDSEARWYYPAIMRTTTMDPLCEKYYSTSPYAWCSNNPVNIVDPDGRTLFYAKGSRPEFKNNVIEAVKYLKANGIDDLFNSIQESNIKCYIQESDITQIRVESSSDAPGGFIVIVEWNPELGLMNLEKTVILSPTTCLNHEFDHTNAVIMNPNAYMKRHNSLDANYENKEEKRVIQGSEQRTAKKLGEIKPGQVTRREHKGISVKVATPTSNVMIDDYE